MWSIDKSEVEFAIVKDAIDKASTGKLSIDVLASVVSKFNRENV